MAVNPLIEEHMEELSAALKVRGGYRDRVLAEFRAHLEDAADAATARGLGNREAAELAIAEVGTPSELAERFVPQATTFTRRSVAAVGLGVVLAAGAVTVAGWLHADGARLGSSILYTAVWSVGWVSLLLIASPAIALFVRHRGHLGWSGALSIVLLAAAIVAVLGFHFTNDGTLSRGPSENSWRDMAILCGAGGTLALAAMTARARLVPGWPLVLIGSGIALEAVHYLILNGLERRSSAGVAGLLLVTLGGKAAVAGLLLVAIGGFAYALVLGRERPLA